MTNQTINYKPGFKTRVNSERSMLMMPMNVVMIARIKGSITKTELQTAIEALRSRHALLAVRVYFDENNVGWYTTDDVPAVTVNEVEATEPETCEKVVMNEWKTEFPYETGPLVRLTLVQSKGYCEMVVTGQHVICDGTSLTYLIRDILDQIGKGDAKPEILPPPLPITSETVPNPKKMKGVQKLVMNLISKKWNKAEVKFNQADMKRMLERFWIRNKNQSILRWELSPEVTKSMVAKCRKEKVTINSALWAAFLAAQYEVQGDSPAFRNQAGMAVSTRDKLTQSVGESFGFYASSLRLSLKYNSGITFWENARKMHEAINKEIDKTDIFRMLVTESLPPSLMDSFYFNKYDGFENQLSGKMLKQMNWDQTSFGYSITNVGKVDIETQFGNRTLEAVYGPILYSDVNEKVVGITTVGGRLSFSMTCGADGLPKLVIEQICEKVMDILKEEM